MELLLEGLDSRAGLVIAFVLLAATVVAAGVRLSVYGDALGERTRLGGGMVGLVFLAAVTSLPELVVSVTSVLQNGGNPGVGADLAVGNMLGSNVFNLLILGLVTLFFPRRFDPAALRSPHTGSVLYGLILLAVFSAAFAAARRWAEVVPGLGCGWPTLLLPLTYFLCLRWEHRTAECPEAKEDESLPEEKALVHMPAGRFYGRLLFFCVLIVAGGIGLSVVGSRMALPPEEGGFGLQAGFIGTLFLAVSTSLPELVISFSAVRLGMLDMAVGNVLGSNMFNLLIIFAADIAMRGKSLLAYASPANWISVGLILFLTVLAMMLLRCRRRLLRLSLAVLMVTAYLISLAHLA